MSNETSRERSFWTTLPGILSGTAAVLVAVTGLVALLYQQGDSTKKSDHSDQLNTVTITPTSRATPSAPTILSPTTGSTLATSSAIVSGKADPSTTVTISERRKRLGAVIANSTGAWSITINMSDGVHHIVATAAGPDSNVSSPSATTSFTVDTRKPETLFVDNIQQPEYKTDSPVELGMKFSPSVDGTVTALRFYKAPNDDSRSHRGTLWSQGGFRLASCDFTFSPSQSGWQVCKLSEPSIVAAHQTYVVSYFDENGKYARTVNFTPHTVGHLTALGGVFAYSARSTFPVNPFNANYWVDLVFMPKLGA